MIAILDIGKTNKKCFVFDEDYHIVFEKTAVLPETTDEDGDPCEDLDLLRQWVLDAVREVVDDFPVRAINCTAYGASFVHVDDAGRPITPLYNYLKPFPDDLKRRFFKQYGGEARIALETASPVLGHLNSGLQLYRLKFHRPELFARIRYALHLPQYVASLLHGRYHSEITSIGCHTMLWDFQKNDYHDWVKAEDIAEKLPPRIPCTHLFPISSNHSTKQPVIAGVGLHDSSAALIPYLATFTEPFVLISTGTWCISLNPFNHEPLTPAELAQDCLCYLSYSGRPVKAARYFGGHEHEQAVKKLATEYGVPDNFYQKKLPDHTEPGRNYTAFMRRLVNKQAASTRLAIGRSPVQRIFVDGGFSKNERYMTYLARAFPKMQVCAAEVPQSTALGAALAVHAGWNTKPWPGHLIELQVFSS